MNLEKIMTKLFLSCKEATCLIEKQSVFPLTFKEKCRLYVHVKMCVVCNLYRHQSKTIEKALSKWINSEGATGDLLPPKTKERIIEKIKED
ncbi:hypothetical protein [Cyclobacterium plantarum]|uniref:Zinc-finger domain-containing protein n=1 Tax=Cyclobacterium plantarum TaxID=2716263 RepID=A0ABX0H946_9BACT|nr:hypothetical protein [Cyclobacterium plantarum]NHE56942.1 hypothetical protein [Cyclobacterium plantarum]